MTTLIRVGGEVKADVYVASLQFPHTGFSAIEVIEVPCCELPHPLFVACSVGTFCRDGFSTTMGPSAHGKLAKAPSAPGSNRRREVIPTSGASEDEY